MENDNDGGSEIPNESSKDPESSNDHLSTTTTVINKTILPEPLTKLLPPKNIYFIEQMKNGLSIANILINEKNRLIFGRARDCDIPMDHPSISRYHAALLWAPKNDDEYKNGTNTESFWYLIDCGSTHGTICNKKSIDPGKMIKIIPNNNVFRFGASTRLFTLGSSREDSNDDDSGDSNEELNSRKVTKRTKEEQDTDDACTWGISLTDCTEDDDEEIGDSLALKSIIMAMKDGQSSSSKLQSTNENVYSDNPYKCLQQWFENEGYDLDYKVDSLHNKFKCTFDLPIDGQWIPVDGQLMTRKKESIQDACLRCCRLLDQANLLFAWQRKDSAREKARKEFYNNDDDDDLLDETIKPATKKLRKDSEGKIETYDSLNLKWKEINQELCQLKVRLAHIDLEPGVTPEISQDLIGDSLDIYMNSLNQKKYGLSMNEKIEKSNLKIKIKQLETEQSKIEKLIQLARPAEIVMKNLTATTTTLKTEPAKESSSSQNDENEIKMEKKSINKEESNEKVIESSTNSVADDNSDGKSEISQSSNSENKKKNYKEFRKIRQQSTIEAIEREKRLEKQREQQQQKQQQQQQQSIEPDDDFVDLVRLDQQQQTGDGRTHLNEKFGY